MLSLSPLITFFFASFSSPATKWPLWKTTWDLLTAEQLCLLNWVRDRSVFVHFGLQKCFWIQKNKWNYNYTVRSCLAPGRGRPKRTWREVVKEDCQARKLNTEDAMDHSKWRKLIKDVRWPGWVWVGECFFWYWPTRVVPGQRPLNGCVCVLAPEYMMQDA